MKSCVIFNARSLALNAHLENKKKTLPPMFKKAALAATYS